MRLRLLLLSLLVTLLGVAAPAAQAAGTPNISLDKNAPGSVLFGEDSTVTLSASNPSGPTGYNLSFRDVLPVGVSYVAGSASVAPRVLPNAPAAGQTTLLFENVSDLSGGSSYSLSYEVRHSTTTYTVGSSYTNDAGAYVNSDPRYLPKFTATGTPIGPTATSYTGFATDSAVTQIAAIEILKSEPSPEGELLRGAHDHQTVYTLSVRNNGVQPTTNLVVDDYLPAGLEFLGCGTADNTTDAPTNPGQTNEYPGSGPLNPGNAPSAPGCIAPTLVETLFTDPDGGGPRPLAVYTHVRFTPAAGTLTPGQTITLRYVAAIPIRENTTAWPGGMTPTPAAGTQASNLDNNSGAETSDEQALTNYARAAGDYNGTLPVSDDVSLTRSAEDLAIHKSVDDATIVQGDISVWTLNLQTSEYRYVDDLRVTDTVPDGLCPLGAVNFETTPPAANAECNPVGGQTPSSAYSDVTENSDGSWTIEWDDSTVPALARMGPSADFDITFPTRTRAFYQNNFADAGPVLTRDSWVNNVSVLGADFAICAPADPDCSGTGTPIDGDEIDGIDDLDVSSAGQEAGGVAIDKRVGQPQASPVDCALATYVDGPPPLYGPGDRVCWRVRVDFAGQLDSGLPQVTDFLPIGTVYEAGSAVPTAANDVSSTLDASQAGVLIWDLGSTVDSGGLVFEWIFSTIVTKDSSSTSGDVPGNLMKFAYSNSGGTTFPLRDQVDFERDEAELSLLKGVRDVNGAGGLPANTDNREVQGGDTVTYRVDITNDGARAAEDIEVWDDLPAGIDCSAVTNISDGGTCNTVPDRIEWSGLTLAAGASDTLTYDLVIPTTVSPAQTLTNRAGVRSYRSDTNIGGSFLYIPENNIDPALTTPNAVRADDVSNVFTDPVTLVKARTTEVTGPGNTAADAAIGEEITYTLTATIPQGTTIYDSPTLTDVLSPRLTYMAGSATATLNGTGLPTGGLTLTASGSPTTIGVAFPSTYTNAAGSGDDVLVVTFQAKLADVSTNFRLTGGTPVPNSGTLAWDDQGGTARTVSGSVNTNVSEPVLSLAKNENDADDAVDPGQIVHYIVTATNGSAVRTSTAHDLIAIDTLPLGVTPVNAGVPVADGGTVGPDLGIWNSAARTITWNVTSLAPGASALLDYDVEIDDPAVVGTTFPNSATLTGTSLPDGTDDDGGERGPSSTRTTGYIAAANDVVRLGTASVTKTVSAPTATIGEERVFTVDAVIPGGVEFFDTTVIDTLPDGYDYDSTTSITCLAPCVPAITGTTLPAEPQAGGETRLGWFLGDLAPAAADRTVRIVYRAHVDDNYVAPVTPVVAPNTLVNGVAVYANRTNDLGTPSSIPLAASFDESTPLATALTTVTEPALSLDKAVTDDAGNDDIRPTQPGDSYTYTVSVTNNGSSPAYDVEVSDQPDAELENVVLTTGSALVTSDGWTAGDPDIHWLIPGPIAPGATVIMRYTADLVASPGLAQGQLVVNTADVDRYWGVSQAERTANGHDYREYTSVPSDTVTLVVDLPQLTVTKTTGASGNPDTANAEVGQAFPWRVVIANTSSAASALDVDVSDVLPPNWTYVAGSASFAPGGAVEPTVTAAPTGDTLAWSNVGDLAPGAQMVLTFNARPTLASATTPGSGAGNPHINTGSADAVDASGAGGSADGPYADSDTARAILLMPSLAIAKTPDAGAATAGALSNFSVRVDNTGTGTARNVVVTDVLPAGAAYTAGTATAAPGAGFTEASVTAGPGPGQTTIVWNIASIASGAGVTITVPVRPAASLADGTTLTNNASVLSDELPTPVSDPGSFVVSSSADVSILKTTSQTSVTAGETIDYVLRAENAGPSDALGVVVSDVLPANVTFVSAEAPCTHSAGTVTCVLGTLAAGANRELDLRVRVLTGATGSVVNPAEVTSDTPDSDSSNNEDDVTTPIGATAGLRIDKSTVAPTFIQGDQITYEIAVTNDGPSDAVAVTVTDVLPAGVSYVSATPDQGTCAHAAGTVTCALGAIAAGMTANIELVVNADDDGTIVNVASVSSPTDPTDDDDDASVTVAPAADLAMVKTGDATVTAGGQANYSFTVTNNGPSDATGVQAADALPAGTTLVSSLPAGECTAAGELVTCDVGDLASGASETFDLVVAVPFALADQMLTNIAVVTGDQADTDNSNDGDSANTTVGPAADLTLEKTGGTATSGGTVTWTLVVSNGGPSTATGVTLEDPLPSGLTFVSATPSQGACSEAGGTVSCALGTIASGASAQVTIVAGVPADIPAGTTVSNTATVDSEQPDPTPDDNTDRVITPVEPPPPTAPNLAVVKRASVERPRLGVPFTYFIDVSNAGPGPATNVKLTDTLSADVKLVTASVEGGGHCARRGQAISCSLGDLAAGESARVRLRVRPLRTGRLDNTASAAADQSDLDEGDNRDTARVRVRAPKAAYSLTKRADRAAVAGGDMVRFKIVVRMRKGAGSGVRICDRLPDGLVFVRARGATFRSGQACWRRTYMAPGSVLRLKVVTRAQRGFAFRRIKNTAIVTGQNLARRTDSAPVAISPAYGGAPSGVTG